MFLSYHLPCLRLHFLMVKWDNPLPQTVFEIHYYKYLLTICQYCYVFNDNTFWGAWYFFKAHSVLSIHLTLGQSSATGIRGNPFPLWASVQFSSQRPWPHHIPEISLPHGHRCCCHFTAEKLQALRSQRSPSAVCWQALEPGPEGRITAKLITLLIFTSNQHFFPHKPKLYSYFHRYIKNTGKYILIKCHVQHLASVLWSAQRGKEEDMGPWGGLTLCDNGLDRHKPLGH